MIETSRCVGSMLLLAIGDALGAPLEGLNGPHIAQLYGGPVEDYVDPLVAWRDKPFRWRLKGLHTDDTQQALIVAEVLLDCGGWDSAAAANWHVAMARPSSDLIHGVHRGTGANFRHCVKRMAEGRDAREWGAPSAGAGAAMRIAPIGLWYADDHDALIDAAIECSLMTHTDARGILGAVAVAAAVALLASESAAKIDAPAVAQEIVEATARAEERLWEIKDRRRLRVQFGPRPFVSALESLPGLLREGSDDLARRSIVQEANRHEPEHPIGALNQPFAPACVPAAIYRALASRSPMEGLIAAINDGYDTDTMGAITGAMLGARFGEEHIPREWREGLLAAEAVAARGEALASRQKDLSHWDDLLTLEREFTLRETEERIELVKAWQEENRKRLEKHPERAAAEEKRKKEKQQRAIEVEATVSTSAEDKKRRRREREKSRKQRDRERKRKRDRRSDFIARGEIGLYEPDGDG